MKKSQLFFLAFITLLLNHPATSLAASLSECNDIVSVYNESLPMVVDKFTTAQNIVCIYGANKPTILYSYELKAPYSKILFKSINENRKKQVATWCSQPNQRMLLEDYNVSYMYKDINGKFITDIKFASNDCK
jgi:hypothetical protein